MAQKLGEAVKACYAALVATRKDAKLHAVKITKLDDDAGYYVKQEDENGVVINITFLHYAEWWNIRDQFCKKYRLRDKSMSELIDLITALHIMVEEGDEVVSE